MKRTRRSGKGTHPSRNRLLAPLKRAYERFLKIRGTPREIALGFSLGLFVGMTPLMGLHTLIAVPLAALFKWNKISAAVAVWVTNAITAPIIYGGTYLIGAKIAGIRNSLALSDAGGFSALYELLLNTPEIFWAMTIGGIVVGIPLAVAGYYTAFFLVDRYRQKIKRKLEASRKKRSEKKSNKKKSQNANQIPAVSQTCHPAATAVRPSARRSVPARCHQDRPSAQ
jgi:uncharacterized protein (DUF2062 family)